MSTVQQPTLLIVDDSTEIISVLNGILREQYKIKAAPNGLRGLELARQSPPPDLILLDVVMPELDGYEVCQRLKADAETADIPVLFITARDDDEDEAHGLALGAVDYITKPIRPSIVRARVATHLHIRQMQRELEEKNQALEETARLRDDVERITQHDLKAPLNIVISGPALLAERCALQDADRQVLNQIEQAGHRILKMINRSLDLYKMETGTYSLNAEPMDLVPLLRGITQDALLAYADKGQRAEIRLQGVPIGNDSQCLAKGESMLAFSMFENLIKNALEAAPHEATLHIDIERGAGCVAVRITNPGAIPEAIRPTFFSKYVTAGKSDGTGLGTYSARLCAQTQRGDITMQVLDERHTQLTVTLPLYDAEAELLALQRFMATLTAAPA